MSRDPRVNPQVGDVTENLNGTRFEIYMVHKGEVHYNIMEGHLPGAESDSMPLEEWRDAARGDKVIRAVGEANTTIASEGWIRYWICDKSGAGHGKWKYLYMPGYTDPSDVKESVLAEHENWAIFADSYSMEVEVNVEPPMEEVFIAIEHYETLAKDYANIAANLRKTVGL